EQDRLRADVVAGDRATGDVACQSDSVHVLGPESGRFPLAANAHHSQRSSQNAAEREGDSQNLAPALENRAIDREGGRLLFGIVRLHRETFRWEWMRFGLFTGANRGFRSRAGRYSRGVVGEEPALWVEIAVRVVKIDPSHILV